MSPAHLSATETDGSPELAFAFCDRGIVKAELFTVGHSAGGVQGNGEAPTACHDLRLAVGVAAVTDAAGKGALHKSIPDMMKPFTPLM